MENRRHQTVRIQLHLCCCSQNLWGHIDTTDIFCKIQCWALQGHYKPLTKLKIIPALSPAKRTPLGSGEQLGSAFGPGFKLDRFWVSKAFKKCSPSSHKESCFGALAWKAAWKLKNLLVSFNFLRINPSLRIALVLWNFRVWHKNVFLLNLSLLHFLGARRESSSKTPAGEGLRALWDQEMCGGGRRNSEAAEPHWGGEREDRRDPNGWK